MSYKESVKKYGVFVFLKLEYLSLSWKQNPYNQKKNKKLHKTLQSLLKEKFFNKNLFSIF